MSVRYTRPAISPSVASLMSPGGLLTSPTYAQAPPFITSPTTRLTEPLPPLTQLRGPSIVVPSIEVDLNANNALTTLAELIIDNNDANLYADRLINHINIYGETSELHKMLREINTFEMQDFVLMKVSFYYAVRLDVLKVLVPLSLYSQIADARAEARRNQHIKQILHILKYMDRSDLIIHLRERFGEIIIEG